jgi:transglutaminase-like putative cysteine protease
MNFNVSSTLEYTIQDLSTFIFNISVLKTLSQTVLEESLTIDPYLLAEELPSMEGNTRGIRIESTRSPSLKIGYQARVNLQYEIIPRIQLQQVPISKLPPEVIPYLFPSRYCQSDKLTRLATDKFGHFKSAYEKILAVCHWISENVSYVIGSTDSNTSAFDTVTQRVGVCRDFAHLGVALARGLGIPARYFSCYAHQLSPQDFHACFDVYLGGKWVSFDPSRMAPLNGLIRIGVGRDAADVSVATIYGNVGFKNLWVSNNSADNIFKGIFMNDVEENGIYFKS